jgi:Transposase zinc-ribbon domain
MAILDDDERPRLCTNAGISRLLAGDRSYRHTSLLLFGNAGFTLGMLAAQGFVNQRRRRQARRDQVPAWRSYRLGTVIVTDRRIMCSATDGTLLDFWFDHVTEFYPALASRSVVFAFGEACAPLRIDGPTAPAVALWGAVGLYGYRWVDDMRLQPLTHHRPPWLLPQARPGVCTAYLLNWTYAGQVPIADGRPVGGVDYPRTYQEFRAWFPDDESCARYLADLRWPDGFRCPMCGGDKAYPHAIADSRQARSQRMRSRPRPNAEKVVSRYSTLRASHRRCGCGSPWCSHFAAPFCCLAAR